MQNIFTSALLLLLVGIWCYRIGHEIAGQIKRQKRLNWLVAISGLVVTIGASGFFAILLVSTGTITLPNSFEWPAGDVSGVVETWDGKYLVPLVPVGRLQIYDSSWHFLRGWQVNTNGGSFTVENSPNNEILVSTSRVYHRFGSVDEARRYVFTENGKLISEISPNYSGVTESEDYMSVPTRRLLWIFSSPYLSGGFGLTGMLGLLAAEKLYGSKTETGTNHSV